MTHIIAVRLVAYVGIVRVASVTLDRFTHPMDAQHYIELIQEVKPQDVEELEEAIRKFIRFPDVMFFFRREEEDIL